MPDIIHICKKCNSKVDIMSVVEDYTIIDGKRTPIVTITYICTKCGCTESTKHYLYKKEK